MAKQSKNMNDPTKGKVETFDIPPELLAKVQEIATELAEEYGSVTEPLMSRMFLGIIFDIISKVEAGVAPPALIGHGVRLLVEHSIEMDQGDAVDKLKDSLKDIPEDFEVVPFHKTG